MIYGKSVYDGKDNYLIMSSAGINITLFRRAQFWSILSCLSFLLSQKH